MIQNLFKVLEKQNMQNQTISELYINDKKAKYSNNPKHIFKSPNENLYTRWNVSKFAINEFLNKILNHKKISNKHFNLCETEISLDEIIEAINSQKNNKSPGNNGLITEF